MLTDGKVGGCNVSFGLWNWKLWKMAVKSAQTWIELYFIIKSISYNIRLEKVQIPHTWEAGAIKYLAFFPRLKE